MKKKAAVRIVLHEKGIGKHRIVIVSSGQTITGPWADDGQLAELNGFLANTGANKQLPVGVFRVNGVEQQVLS